MLPQSAMPPKKSRSGTDHRMLGSTCVSSGRTGAIPGQLEASSSSAQFNNDGRPVARAATQQATVAEVQDARETADSLVVRETFTDYVPAKLKIGIPHPDHVVETTSMRSISPPDIRYNICLPKTVIEQGLLSALQLEAITYACQQHETMNNGERAGFLIGDGAGVGKGRTIAGIIYENWLRGRRKSIWFSVSPDLKVDAERDLGDINAEFINVHPLSGYQKITVKDGVMFSSFSGLIGKTISKKSHFNNRLDQLVDWCGERFMGVIVFDECHRAKNLHPTNKSMSPTQVGLAVRAIQDRLPAARIIYASATGATEPRHMGYMVRLGLWAAGTAFLDFPTFRKSIENCGIAAMEIVAMEMKHRGMYIARQLSFSGVTFSVEEVSLNAEFIELYDRSVEFWIMADKYFHEASSLVNLGKNDSRTMRMQFWAAHQRFFKYLCLDAKIDAAVRCAESAILHGKCVVIGLQSTGEAKTAEIIEKLDSAGEELEYFVSTARAVLSSLLDQFPSKPNPDCKAIRNQDTSSIDDWSEISSADMDELQDSTVIHKDSRRTTRSDVGNRLSEMKGKLLAEFEKFADRLPANMLDKLIDRLGGPGKVAEMTGRKGRMVADNEGRISYEKRQKKDDTDSVNISERELFMNGEKLIAIISEAASVGISLHADRRAKNQRRRLHITLELAWSADRAIQQFGRTHRSNQSSAPEYIFLISEVAGEKRFASVVANRLERLGALTHGDRRASEARDLSVFNIDSQYGQKALNYMLNICIRGYVNPAVDILDVPQPRGFENSFADTFYQALNSVGLIRRRQDYTARVARETGTTVINVNRFMNRLLGVTIGLQNAIFQYFTEALGQVIEMAKKDGSFDSGTLEIGRPGSYAQLKKRTFFTQKDSISSRTNIYDVVSDRGLKFKQAEAILNRQKDLISGFYTLEPNSSGVDQYVMLIVPSLKMTVVTEGCRSYGVYRPNTGRSSDTVSVSDIRKKRYCRISDLKTAKKLWDGIYAATEYQCYHRSLCGPCNDKNCMDGSRAVRTKVLSGNILGIWRELETVFGPRLLTVQIVRVIFSDAHRIIGVQLPSTASASVLSALQKSCGKWEDDTFAARAELDIEEVYTRRHYQPDTNVKVQPRSPPSSACASVPTSSESDSDIDCKEVSQAPARKKLAFRKLSKKMRLSSPKKDPMPTVHKKSFEFAFGDRVKVTDENAPPPRVLKLLSSDDDEDSGRKPAFRLTKTDSEDEIPQPRTAMFPKAKRRSISANTEPCVKQDEIIYLERRTEPIGIRQDVGLIQICILAFLALAALQRRRIFKKTFVSTHLLMRKESGNVTNQLIMDRCCD